MKILSRDQMRELDRISIEEYGISSLKLMEQAGRVCSRFIKHQEKKLSKLSVVVICGSGNNGGDGLVIARLLKKYVKSLKVYILSSSFKDLAPDSQVQFQKLKKYKVEPIFIEHAKIDFKSDLIIDALFGTGLSRKITGYRKNIIQEINKSNGKVYSIDCPSGLCSDSGKVLGECVQSNFTISLELPKIGFFINQGPEYIGFLIIKKIGLERKMINQIPLELITKDKFNLFIKKRSKTSHKGTYGHVFIVGTSKGKIGSGVLAAKAALKSGAGLSTLVLPESCYQKIESDALEIMYEPIQDCSDGYFKESMMSRFNQRIKDASLFVVGVGMGTELETKIFFSRLLKNISKPMIIDADGLNILSQCKSILRGLNQRIILTPHPKEMARLIGKSVKYVQSHRLEVVHDFCKKYEVYLVLKGYNSVIGFPDGRLFINPTGNASMSNAGQGDALTGIIAGVVSEFDDHSKVFEKSLLFAVFLHGLVGDILNQEGYRVVLASDIIHHLHRGYGFLKKRNQFYLSEF